MQFVKSSIRNLRQSAIFRSFLITTFGSGISKLILILSTFYCTHVLTKAEFGEFSFIRNTLNMVLCICALNFASLCTKFTVEAQSAPKSRSRLIILFLFSLVICLAIGLALLLLPQSVLYAIFKSETGVFYFRIIGLLLPLFMLQPLIEGVLRGLMKFKLIGVLQTGSSLFYLAALIVGTKLRGYDGAVAGMLIYYSVYAVVSIAGLGKRLLRNTNRQIFGGIAENISVVREMILPIFIMSFIEAPVFWFAQRLLIQFDSMAAVGGMTVITQIRNLAILIPSYFFSTYLAYASRLNSDKEYGTYFGQFKKLQRTFLLTGIAAAVLLTLAGNPVLYLYNTSYLEHYPQLVISNIGIPVLLLSGLLKIELIIQEHQKQLLYISVAWNLLWIGLLVLLLMSHVHALTAFFTTQFIAFLFQYILVYRVYRRDRKELLSKP